VTLAQKVLPRFGDACMELARRVAQRVLHLAQVLVLPLEIQVYRARVEFASHLGKLALDACSRVKFRLNFNVPCRPHRE
jgi:hypothetical protein